MAISAAFVPGRILLSAPSSCAAEVSSRISAVVALIDGLCGPNCSSGRGGGDGSRGELKGDAEFGSRAGDFAAIFRCCRTLWSALILKIGSTCSLYASEYPPLLETPRIGGIIICALKPEPRVLAWSLVKPCDESLRSLAIHYQKSTLSPMIDKVQGNKRNLPPRRASASSLLETRPVFSFRTERGRWINIGTLSEGPDASLRSLLSLGFIASRRQCDC